MKKISCGTIIVYDGKILICRPSWKRNDWNLPKGLMYTNENYIVAAIRETYEECNIDININIKKIEDVGLLPYLNDKDLYLFLVEIEHLPDNIKCNSFFEKDGKLLPEMVDYKWIEIDEYKKYLCHHLVVLFDEIYEKIVDFTKKHDIFELEPNKNQ